MKLLPVAKGSRAPEFFNEKDDCAVRAIANACGVSYMKAHKACADHGRAKRSGMFVDAFDAALNSLVKIKKSNTFKKNYFVIGELTKSGITLGRFIKENSTGTWIVMIANHFLAIEAGSIIDTTYPSDKSHVYYAWKI